MKITCAKCGEYLDLNRIYLYRYCTDCHNEHMRNNRKPYDELSIEEKTKAKVRATARHGVTRGKIERKPCAKCGTQKAEMHHEDYGEPLEVIWLCRPCHNDLHDWKKILERNRSEVKERETTAAVDNHQ